jgi:hypothetical protein
MTMWTLMAIAAAGSITFGLIAVGLIIWHDDKSDDQNQRQI